MLGEQIGQDTGKVVLRRVIATDGNPKVEVTVQSDGKLLGVEARSTVTYCAEIRPDGTLYADAQGIVIGKNGETASFKAHGVGKMLGGGAVSYRGATYYYSTTPKLSRLDSIAGVFEYEADADGNSSGKIWEWR